MLTRTAVMAERKPIWIWQASVRRIEMRPTIPVFARKGVGEFGDERLEPHMSVVDQEFIRCVRLALKRNSDPKYFTRNIVLLV